MCQRFAWRFSSELGEIADHVHLVVIAETESYVSPRGGLKVRFAFQRTFEASNSREQLGPHAYLPSEAPLELAQAEAGSMGQRWYRGPPTFEDLAGFEIDRV